MNVFFIILLTFALSEGNPKDNPKYKPFLYFSIAQSVSLDMQDIYSLYPSLGMGISSDFAPHKSFRIGLDFIYDRGSIWDSEHETKKEVDLTVLSLESGWQFGTTPYQSADFYCGAGLIFASGMEYFPYTGAGSTSDKRYNGVGLGAFVIIGSHLVPLGNYSIGIEGKLRLLRLLVSNKDWWQDYWYTYERYYIDLSGISLAITLGRWP
jgi:hypothetical protein